MCLGAVDAIIGHAAVAQMSKRGGSNSFPRIARMFAPLPDKPDHDALERGILDRWEREHTFERLRERNRGGPTFSFVDGPVTANKMARRPHRLGAHAEGRLPALQGAARLRPALPERVRLPGPLDRGRRRARARAQLEARDRGVRARRVRAPLPRRRRRGRPQALTRGLDPARPVDGLGQRLLHLQRHEHRVHLAVPEARARARLALPRPPLDRVVPALRHVALPARADPVGRLPGASRPVALSSASRSLDRDGESLVVWTTTPWTLPANVAAAVNPDAEYGRRANGEWVAAGRGTPTSASSDACPASELVGWRYRGPFDDARARAARSSTASSRGTRSRSRRAPASSTSRRAAAARTSSSARAHDLPVLTPVDEAGRFYDDYGWLHGLSTDEAADQIVGDLARAGPARRGGHVRAPLSRTAGAATRR